MDRVNALFIPFCFPPSLSVLFFSFFPFFFIRRDRHLCASKLRTKGDNRPLYRAARVFFLRRRNSLEILNDKRPPRYLPAISAGISRVCVEPNCWGNFRNSRDTAITPRG